MGLVQTVKFQSFVILAYGVKMLTSPHIPWSLVR